MQEASLGQLAPVIKWQFGNRRLFRSEIGLDFPSFLQGASDRMLIQDGIFRDFQASDPRPVDGSQSTHDGLVAGAACRQPGDCM